MSRNSRFRYELSRSFNARIEIKRWTNNQQWMLKRQGKDDVLTGYPRIIALGQFPDRGKFPFLPPSFLLIIADKPIVRNDPRFRTGGLRTNNLGSPSFYNPILFRKLMIGDDLIGDFINRWKYCDLSYFSFSPFSVDWEKKEEDLILNKVQNLQVLQKSVSFIKNK